MSYSGRKQQKIRHIKASGVAVIKNVMIIIETLEIAQTMTSFFRSFECLAEAKSVVTCEISLNAFNSRNVWFVIIAVNDITPECDFLLRGRRFICPNSFASASIVCYCT